MRKLLVLLTAMLTLAAAPEALAATVNVSITRAGFVPDTVNVRVGDTVTWTNNDTVTHQVVSTQCNFTSPVLAPGAAFSRTFTTAGRCQYEDPLRRPRLRGTVNVAAGPVGITVRAAPVTVTYGRSTTLSGQISSGATGERVTVQAQACGGAFARVAEVTTTAGGAWTLVVKPVNNTTYRVQWRNASATLAVKVRPLVRLRKLTSNRWTLRVFAAQSFSGRVATFQRFNATTRRWVRLKLLTLRSFGTAATPINPSRVSGANWRLRVRLRTRVRVILPQTQVGGCYVAGVSNVVVR